MVNFASERELLDIPGVASRTAEVIVSVRNNKGSLTLDLLQSILRKTFDEDEVALLDFTPNDKLPLMWENLPDVPFTSQRRNPDADKEGKYAHALDSLLESIKQSNKKDSDMEETRMYL